MTNRLDKMFESDFIRVPRFLIHKFGLNEAVLLSEVYSEYKYWKEKGCLQQGGWFFSTIDNMHKNTGLTRHHQLTAVKKLCEHGIIQVKYNGMPKKRYFKFNSTMYNQLYEEFQLSVNSTEDVEEDDEYYFEEQIAPKKTFKFSF